MGCLGPQSRVQLVQHLIALLTPVIYGAGCHSISESVSPHRTFFKNTSLQETHPCLFDSESIQSWSKAKRQAHSEWRRTSQETQAGEISPLMLPAPQVSAYQKPLFNLNLALKLICEGHEAPSYFLFLPAFPSPRDSHIHSTISSIPAFWCTIKIRP